MPRFAFDFSSPLAAPLRLTGLGSRIAQVVIEHGVLDVRFGLLRVRTPLRNVAGAEVTGPYNPLKSLGVHVSLADRGLTLGTSTGPGLCIRFHRPVSLTGVVPVPLPVRHPALTVTVVAPELLHEALLRERDVALAEEDRLLAREDAADGPAGAPRPPTVLARRPAGTVRLTPRVPRRTAERAGDPLAERPGPPDPSVATPVATPPPRKRAARPAADRNTTVKKVATRRPATKSVNDELAARRLAGNRPDETPPIEELEGPERVAAASGLPVELPVEPTVQSAVEPAVQSAVEPAVQSAVEAVEGTEGTEAPGEGTEGTEAPGEGAGGPDDQSGTRADS